jgi:hypothetical protein
MSGFILDFIVDPAKIVEGTTAERPHNTDKITLAVGKARTLASALVIDDRETGSGFEFVSLFGS